MTAARESAKVDRLLAGLFVVVAIVTLIVAVQQRQRAVERLNDPNGGQINDFDRWMRLAPTFVDDHADYVNDDLPTPPISLLVFAPLAALGRPNAQFAWALLKLPAACAVFVLAMGIVRRAGGHWTAAAAALVASGWWLAVVIDFQEGQMNLVTLLPLVAGLYVAQQETAVSAMAGGLLIGLAIAIKVTPIIFVAYFLWQRRFALASAVLAAIALWSLVPALAFGWGLNLRWLNQWARIMLVPYVTRGTVAYATSQSIGSFALRLLTDMPAFDSHRNGLVQGHYMHVASLAQTTVHQIVRGVMVLVGVIGLWWTRRPLATLKSHRYVFEIGAVAAFMLWFSERTWIPHYVSFILTLGAAGMVLSDAGVPTRSRHLVRWALILFAVVTPFASEIGRVFGPDGVDWAKSLGVYLWPSVVVTLATVLTTVAQRRSDRIEVVG
jgi:glycosyl transferase family 87